ncbi:MAG: YihY/virulence factor BrkB family protein [Solirubrobacterales bacterium]|nr:YihY/virulence factor BrkB family protein [Solirubrobacterales bacterium]
MSLTPGARARYFEAVRRTWTVTRRAVIGFYQDQGTHHAAALTYYALMSLFPSMLLAVSLLGLLGEYPTTYNSLIKELRKVVPATTLAPLDDALRAAFRNTGTAVAALVIGVLTAFFGATGFMEASRRALNVIFDSHTGRSFVRRKLTDIVSLVLLFGLVVVTLVLMFAGQGAARDVAGSEAAQLWPIARWPAAVGCALLIFSFIYYVTPDVDHRSFRWVTPGAAVGVTVWVLASAGFSYYLQRFSGINVTYGSFAAPIILLFWLWLTNVAMLFGAEINAENSHYQHAVDAMAAEDDTRDLRSPA